MFKDSRIDSEQSHEVSFATGTTCSVQPLRIDPINGGAWCLPGIHPDIPVVIDTGDLAADAIIARLALEAHAAGVCIPEGEFTTPEDTLKKQWTNYVNSAVGEHSSLYMHMQVHAATDNITVGFEPPGNIEIFRMKPLVEELNAACRGLGWWVVDVAFSACQDRYQIYTPVVVADYLEMNVPGNSFADSDVVANFNEWEGTDLTQAQIQESNEFFWPSDLIKSVGDHAWMLKRTLYDPKTGRFNPIGKKPYVASLSKARAFAKNSTDPRLKQAVADFILLHEELARKDSLMREVEPSSNFYASFCEELARKDTYAEPCTSMRAMLNASVQLQGSSGTAQNSVLKSLNTMNRTYKTAANIQKRTSCFLHRQTIQAVFAGS
jgi:PRTRC genetic system protein F